MQMQMIQEQQQYQQNSGRLANDLINMQIPKVVALPRMISNGEVTEEEESDSSSSSSEKETYGQAITVQ